MVNKNIKEFGKYFSLILAIYFLSETFKYYLPITFSSQYGWIGAIIFAFLFYLLSK